MGKERMKFPIKYLEENLVFNKNTGAVYAYYEFPAYNYNFISEDKAIGIERDLEQLISSSKTDNFHMLTIASEESIDDMIERSKRLVKGELKELAYRYLDGIREHLHNRYGRYVVGYRYYIGFELSANDNELTTKNVFTDMCAGIKDFTKSVNETVFGDYVKIDNAEIERYLRLENLLCHKVTKRFRLRRAEPRDMAYVIKHLNCEETGSYDSFSYQPEIIVEDMVTRAKRYDVIRLSDCLVTNHARYLDIITETGKHYVAYLALSDITNPLEFPYRSEVLFYQQESFSFPVDVSVKVEVLHNREALISTRNKKSELKDLDESAFESGNESSENLINSRRDAHELESDLERSKEDMYKVSYLVRVTARTREELAKRISEVRDFYKAYNMILQRPFGDMVGLHEEFYPATSRYMNDYIHYVKNDFLASLGFGAVHKLGEKEGIYIGWEAYTGMPVFIQPWLAAQGVSGTVTNALAKAFLGSLGGGKSVAMNLISFYTCLFGGKSFILDPKGERGNWREDFAFMGKHLNIINVTSEESNRGLCDPFSIFRDRREAESWALNVLTFLTGCSSRDGERFPVLAEHVKKVSDYPDGKPCGMCCIIEELEKTDTEISRSLATHISSFTELGIARLIFGNGNCRKSLEIDKIMNVVLIQNLSLPDSETPIDKYTMVEIISVAILLVLSAFSLEFIKQNRSVYKSIVLDEAWSWLQVAEGKTLSNNLVRAGRSMNASIDFGTQNCDDMHDEKMKNNIGMKFAFRSRDKNEIAKTLSFLNLENTEMNSEVLKTLQNGENLYEDLYGGHGILHIDCVFDSLFKAWDTRPPMGNSVRG